MAFVEPNTIPTIQPPLRSQSHECAVPNRERILFEERVPKIEDDSRLLLTAPHTEFKANADRILSLKGERDWKELMTDQSEKKSVGEFFKYVEESTKAIIREGSIKKGKESLAMEMILFLTHQIWSDPNELKSNLWILHMSKSDLKKAVSFIVTEILGTDFAEFEKCSWLSDGKKPVQKKFFDQLCTNSDHTSLFIHENEINLEPLQILLWLALCYPQDKRLHKEETTAIPVEESSATSPSGLPAEINAEPRQVAVKPVKRINSGFPLYKIILIISVLAAAALTISLGFII